MKSKTQQSARQQTAGADIFVRRPEDIYTAGGEIEHGTFFGRWHFSFGPYHDTENMQFGRLRVFNDDLLSPGAVWPMHEHHEIEVVTYCAAGEFRHADQNGAGGLLKKGWVQHTTVGSGMWHSEINNRDDIPMRFIQMWFVPSQRALEPSVEQKQIERDQRTNILRLLVSPHGKDSLMMHSDASVYASFLEKDRSVNLPLSPDRGGYLYVLEGGPVRLGDVRIEELGAAKIIAAAPLEVTAVLDAEMLFVETALENPYDTEEWNDR